jgi:PhzF family phenazine biosynthesis protein
MKLPLYQVDAFADEVFKGNPAAVMPLESWLPDATMQAIAAENNLAETAFLVPQKGGLGEDGFGLRWFTPAVEVDLCGHATLASAWVLFNRLGYRQDRIDFFTRSGKLTVTRNSGSERLTLDFPATKIAPVQPAGALIEAIGARPTEVLAGISYLLVYDNANIVRNLRPNMNGLMDLDKFAVIVTAPGDRPGIDCVSRFFAPAKGIPEDPVTGSAHCSIVPYWAKRLGRQEIVAYQASPRGGTLYCRQEGDRVFMAGTCKPYLEGTVSL